MRIDRSQIPDVISTARMLSAPALVALAIFQSETPFLILYIGALISDIADGMAARRLGCTSPSGALLDSIADIMLVVATLVGIAAFRTDVLVRDGWLFAVCLFLWALTNLAGYVRFGRISSLHTRMAQVGMVGFHAFVLILFMLSYFPWILYLVAGVVVLAALEQLAVIFLLTSWTPDMRGGIIEMVRRRSKDL